TVDNGGTATIGAGVTASANRLFIGDAGTGHLLIENGGTLGITRFIHLAVDPGSTGSMTATGADSALTLTSGSDARIVGVSGTGHLLIENGGTLGITRFIHLAVDPGSTGSITVTGAGSALTMTSGSDALIVGIRGDGTLTISDSGTVHVNAGSDVVVGSLAGS